MCTWYLQEVPNDHSRENQTFPPLYLQAIDRLLNFSALRGKNFRRKVGILPLCYTKIFRKPQFFSSPMSPSKILFRNVNQKFFGPIAGRNSFSYSDFPWKEHLSKHQRFLSSNIASITSSADLGHYGVFSISQHFSCIITNYL